MTSMCRVEASTTPGLRGRWRVFLVVGLAAFLLLGGGHVARSQDAEPAAQPTVEASAGADAPDATLDASSTSTTAAEPVAPDTESTDSSESPSGASEAGAEAADVHGAVSLMSVYGLWWLVGVGGAVFALWQALQFFRCAQKLGSAAAPHHFLSLSRSSIFFLWAFFFGSFAVVLLGCLFSRIFFYWAI